MQNIKIPVWLISIVGILFILVTLERLYIAKVPVKIWGLHLNQPSVAVPDTVEYAVEWREVRAAYKENKTIVLGDRSSYLIWALAGQNNYRHGQNNGGSISCDIYVENDVWVLKAIAGDQEISKGAGTVQSWCKAVGVKILRQE